MNWNTTKRSVAALAALVTIVAIAPTALAGDEQPCEPAWHPFESGGQIGVTNQVEAVTVWNGDLIAGGFFATAGGQTVNRIARWDGSAWHPFTSGGQIGVADVSFPFVSALTVWNGDLIAGGQFTTAGGQTVNRVARWDGSAWHPFISGGEVGTNSRVDALTVWNIDLVAGGNFLFAGGQTVNRIASWRCASGACCINGLALGISISESLCLAFGGVYQGDFTVPSKVACPAVCPADVTGDNVVDVNDLLAVIGAWGSCP